jgi:hypothetical protein
MANPTRFDLHDLPDGWHALVHCDCGSTVDSGPRTGPGRAVAGAREGFRLHLAKGGQKCGTEQHAHVSCNCEQCKAHDAELTKMIGGNGRVCKDNTIAAPRDC